MKKPFYLDSNDLVTKDIRVQGEVHISGNLDLINPNIVKHIEKEIEWSKDSIVNVSGDLYIECKEVLVKNAVAYNNWEIKRDKTYNKKSPIKNNVVISIDRLFVIGNIISDHNISYYSDKVHDKVKIAKLKKLKLNIENKKHG